MVAVSGASLGSRRDSLFAVEAQPPKQAEVLVAELVKAEAAQLLQRNEGRHPRSIYHYHPNSPYAVGTMCFCSRHDCWMKVALLDWLTDHSPNQS